MSQYCHSEPERWTIHTGVTALVTLISGHINMKVTASTQGVVIEEVEAIGEETVVVDITHLLRGPRVVEEITVALLDEEEDPTRRGIFVAPQLTSPQVKRAHHLGAKEITRALLLPILSSSQPIRELIASMVMIRKPTTFFVSLRTTNTSSVGSGTRTPLNYRNTYDQALTVKTLQTPHSKVWRTLYEHLALQVSRPMNSLVTLDSQFDLVFQLIDNELRLVDNLIKLHRTPQLMKLELEWQKYLVLLEAQWINYRLQENFDNQRISVVSRQKPFRLEKTLKRTANREMRGPGFLRRLLLWFTACCLVCPTSAEVKTHGPIQIITENPIEYPCSGDAKWIEACLAKQRLITAFDRHIYNALRFQATQIKQVWMIKNVALDHSQIPLLPCRTCATQIADRIPMPLTTSCSMNPNDAFPLEESRLKKLKPPFCYTYRLMTQQLPSADAQTHRDVRQDLSYLEPYYWDPAAAKRVCAYGDSVQPLPCPSVGRPVYVVISPPRHFTMEDRRHPDWFLKFTDGKLAMEFTHITLEIFFEHDALYPKFEMNGCGEVSPPSYPECARTYSGYVVDHRGGRDGWNGKRGNDSNLVWTESKSCSKPVKVTWKFTGLPQTITLPERYPATPRTKYRYSLKLWVGDYLWSVDNGYFDKDTTDIPFLFVRLGLATQGNPTSEFPTSWKGCTADRLKNVMLTKNETVTFYENRVNVFLHPGGNITLGDVIKPDYVEVKVFGKLEFTFGNYQGLNIRSRELVSGQFRDSQVVFRIYPHDETFCDRSEPVWLRVNQKEIIKSREYEIPLGKRSNITTLEYQSWCGLRRSEKTVGRDYRWLPYPLPEMGPQTEHGNQPCEQTQLSVSSTEVLHCKAFVYTLNTFVSKVPVKSVLEWYNLEPSKIGPQSKKEWRNCSEGCEFTSQYRSKWRWCVMSTCTLWHVQSVSVCTRAGFHQLFECRGEYAYWAVLGAGIAVVTVHLLGILYYLCVTCKGRKSNRCLCLLWPLLGVAYLFSKLTLWCCTGQKSKTIRPTYCLTNCFQRCNTKKFRCRGRRYRCAILLVFVMLPIATESRCLAPGMEPDMLVLARSYRAQEGVMLAYHPASSVSADTFGIAVKLFFVEPHLMIGAFSVIMNAVFFVVFFRKSCARLLVVAAASNQAHALIGKQMSAHTFGWTAEISLTAQQKACSLISVQAPGHITTTYQVCVQNVVEVYPLELIRYGLKFDYFTATNLLCPWFNDRNDWPKKYCDEREMPLGTTWGGPGLVKCKDDNTFQCPTVLINNFFPSHCLVEGWRQYGIFFRLKYPGETSRHPSEWKVGVPVTHVLLEITDRIQGKVILRKQIADHEPYTDDNFSIQWNHRILTHNDLTDQLIYLNGQDLWTPRTTVTDQPDSPFFCSASDVPKTSDCQGLVRCDLTTQPEVQRYMADAKHITGPTGVYNFATTVDYFSPGSAYMDPLDSRVLGRTEIDLVDRQLKIRDSHNQLRFTIHATTRFEVIKRDARVKSFSISKGVCYTDALAHSMILHVDVEREGMFYLTATTECLPSQFQATVGSNNMQIHCMVPLSGKFSLTIGKQTEDMDMKCQKRSVFHQMGAKFQSIHTTMYQSSGWHLFDWVPDFTTWKSWLITIFVIVAAVIVIAFLARFLSWIARLSLGNKKRK